jgi:hypothetical protein
MAGAPPAFSSARSILPNLSTVVVTTFAAAFSSNASAAKARHLPPLRVISSARSSSLSLRRAVTTTVAPAAANFNEMARPIPDEAPTIRTTFSLNSIFASERDSILQNNYDTSGFAHPQKL